MGCGEAEDPAGRRRPGVEAQDPRLSGAGDWERDRLDVRCTQVIPHRPRLGFSPGLALGVNWCTARIGAQPGVGVVWSQNSVQGQDLSLVSGLSQSQGSVGVRAQCFSPLPSSTSLPKLLMGRPLAGLQQRMMSSPAQCPPAAPGACEGVGEPPTRGPALTSSFICTSSRALATRSRCLLADSTWLQ